MLLYLSVFSQVIGVNCAMIHPGFLTILQPECVHKKIVCVRMSITEATQQVLMSTA